MTRIIIAYFATMIVFLGFDFVWLTQVGPGLYNPILGSILLQQPRMEPAIAFYLLYGVGLIYFAVQPGLAEGRWQTALVKGGLFGFFAYATYDLTNHATIEVWKTKITLADMAWGTFVSGTASAAGCAITRAVSKG
jgi:uncharacterized membrane protein